MAHEVLGDLFFQDRKQPAWHGIMREGIDESRDYSAAEIYALFGSPKVVLADLQTVNTNKSGEHLAVPYRAIVRAPLPEDPEPRVFGTVSPEYVLVSPEEIVKLYDDNVKRRVQTMMFLREGKLMVITSKLEGFKVRGEDVETYIQIGNWMDGANASTALLSGVCTVCMNTWRMANASAEESYRFVHDAEIKVRMGNWFTQVVARAESNLPMMREAMDLMARTKIGATVSEAQTNVRTVLEAAYPYPNMPKHDVLASDEYNADRLVKWEDMKHTLDARRNTVVELFVGGQATGAGLESRKGTVWGLYQSVVEVEDYRKGALGNNLASAVLFGERAQAKDRAFRATLAIASAN